MSKSRLYISPHARQRAFERYGIILTEKQCKGIYETIRRRKNVVSLGKDGTRNRFACYYERRWYLVGCSENGIVLTFLPIDSLDENMKDRLRNDAVYQRIDNDTFGLFSRYATQNAPLPQRKPTVPKPAKERLNRDRPIKQLGDKSMDPFEFFMADELFFRDAEPVEIECPECGRVMKIHPPENPEIAWYTCRCGWEFSYDWQ